MSPSTTEANHPMRVLFLSGDLMFASKVRIAVDQMGGSMKMSGKLPQEFPDGEVANWTHVVLDLSTRAKLADGIVQHCQAACPQARLIAYGPHVQTELLQRARDAGIETVLTNSQFSRDVGEHLRSAG